MGSHMSYEVCIKLYKNHWLGNVLDGDYVQVVRKNVKCGLKNYYN